MAVEWAAQAEPFIEYDGTNSADICAAIEEFRVDSTATVASEGSGHVTIDVAFPDSPTDEYTLAEGDHFGVTSGRQAGSAEWGERYVKVA